jgi:hypothetical protein
MEVILYKWPDLSNKSIILKEKGLSILLQSKRETQQANVICGTFCNHNSKENDSYKATFKVIIETQMSQAIVDFKE